MSRSWRAREVIARFTNDAPWSAGPGASVAQKGTFPVFRTLVLVAVGELQQIAIERRAKVEEFQRKHRTGLLTLLFTDIVDSTKLKQGLGDREAVPVIQRHHAVIREILGHFSEGEEIETAGDSFFIVFTKPSDAVKFSLLVQARLRALSAEVGRLMFDRIGIHVGEVWIEEHESTGKAQDLYGLQVDTCARVQSLGQADQILLSRFPFDSARQALNTWLRVVCS
jgi:class 3 adenylate cyclase